ncbi:MAG: glucosamine-6-phosphate deaminase [Actinobacteria bacterium]|jgi:glucosamine-6-phosphate deaminase|uniref:Glucosamine-6-phosphate deaminase n=1 Tax=Phycicoccus elongatus Lp2 TaxID=1193181 RepID=N0DZG8_9MICO|nr:glucosamine-6-phosphate deaminase [Phycicoccus elongatus]MCA0321669.1 glucosamine-6-phosphate deaminase [Actinomycetota bacterium]CCH68791.1 Glucosamine-6-phosphate deaminase [Phycicoccus elongatus Lp2]
MEVVIVPTERVGSVGADIVGSLVRRRPESVLGLATGSSPVAMYADLIRRHRDGELSFADVRAFTLDEYVGLPADHPQRYRNVIARDFTDHVDLAPNAVHGPDGLAADIAAACTAYEQAIEDAGGVDLQVLGIGTDGHVAFNEPGSSLASRTRIKTLTRQTRLDNARFFGDDVEQVPVHCLTQGIGTIMEARHLLLLATGRAKAEAIHQLVEGPVSAMWPGTVLQFHRHVTVVVDDAAASRLQLADYYRDTLADKPAWQQH